VSSGTCAKVSVVGSLLWIWLSGLLAGQNLERPDWQGIWHVSGCKGANQAVAAARLGAKVNMIGRLGKDSFGETFLGIMAEEGIDCSHVAVDEDLALALVTR